jgi:anti-anti-sigma factor
MVEYTVASKEGAEVVLQLRGELAGQPWTESLRRALEEHYVDDGVKIIRLELSPLTFLDNFGVATLVALRKESDARGKVLLVEGARGQVHDKLRVTGLLKILGREGA